MRTNFIPLLRRFALLWMMLIIHLLTKGHQPRNHADYKVTLKAEQASLKQVFEDIEKQTGLYFLYHTGHLKVTDKVSIHVTNANLEDVLRTLLFSRGFSWKLMDKAIVLKPVTAATPAETGGESMRTIPMLTGVVTDNSDAPLPGATVQIKGTNKGTLTNSQGVFTLREVDETAVLVVRYTGYHPVEKQLDGKTDLTVKLEQQVKGLDETVVVAYGTTTQRSNTGAVTVVKGGQIETLPNRSFDKSLQGLVPGLLVTNGTGQPGGGVSNMVLRGISTGLELSGSSTVRNPLIVIDGIPVTQDMTQNVRGLYATPVTNPLSQLNPSDIASISVLKDAAAISLYGTRAGNGVILVTTKKGRPGKSIFGFRSQTDLSFRPSNKIKVLDQQSYLDLLYESYKNASPVWTDETIRADLYTKFPYQVNGTDTNFHAAPNWYDAIYDDHAMTFSNDLYLSGGSDKSTFYLNLEYTKQKGIVKSTGLDRKSIRFNFDHTPARWIKLGLNTTLSYSKQDLSNAAVGANEYALANYMSPLNPIWLTDGDYMLNYAWGILQSNSFQVANPVAVAAYNINENIAFRGLSKLSGELYFLKYFSFSSSLGVDFMLAENKQKQDPRLRNIDFSGHGSITQADLRRANIINTNILRFGKTFGSKHTVNALLGQEAQIITEKSASVSVQGTEKTLPYYDDISSPGYTLTGLDNRRNRNTLLSQFGQLNYDYNHKYFLSGSMRRDGASVFGDKQKWGTYWSAGGGWIITAEPFAAGSKKWLNYLKVRGSIGSAGSSGPVGEMIKYTRLGTYSLQDATAFIPTTPPGNPYIQWEETFTWDAGLEVKLFRERISLTADVYHKKTSDLIYTIKLPTYTGYSSVSDNIGDIQNKGVELAVTATILNSSAFRWQMSANWSTNQNILVKSNVPLAVISTSVLANETGRNFNSFYMRQWAGVNPENGKPQWIDSTGKPTSNYNSAMKSFVGKPQPDGFGSFNSTFNYKGLELSLQFYYQYGYQLYDERLAYRLSDGANPYINQSVQAMNRWQKPGDIALNPQRRLGNTDRGNSISTRYLFDADYIRLQNVKLAYTFSKNLVQHLKLSMLSVFVQGNNLGLWTKFTGMDPDNADVAGSVSDPYPVSRSYSAGINVQL